MSLPPEQAKDAALAALERAVHLLDRAHEPGYKSRAFLRAADVVRALDADELADRVGRGTLKELQHIGDATSKLITEAVHGEQVSYLEKLDATSGIAMSPEAAAIRAQLKGDCHTHSTWSDGGASILQMAAAAAGLGHEYLVVTDHSARLTVAHGLSRDRLLQQLDEIDALRDQVGPLQLLTGMEVDILEDGSLDADEDILARLDVVVASVHSKLRMESRPMTERMVLAVASPHVDILGHCTGRLVNGKRPPSTFDAELVFAACAQFGTAVEINSRPERLDPPDELVQIALDMGCRFTIDSDAHAPGQLEWQPYGCEIAARNGVPAERIVNTRGIDGLRSWCRERV
jgi:putative hydrolase